MVGRTTEPNARIGPIQTLLRNAVPPPIQIIDVKPHHEVLRKILIIETLENELGPSVSKAGVAIALPPLLEPQLGEQSPTRLVIFAAWYEWKQRIREQIFHGSAFNTVYGLRMPLTRSRPLGSLLGERPLVLLELTLPVLSIGRRSPRDRQCLFH